jgi:RHS repeat-associated protein
MPTDKLYTGQREITALGIYHYGARFYSQKLGRFLSPDSIVPGAANPQAFNRYSYGLNNPSRYTDPTGHMAISDTNEAGCSGQGPSCIIDMYSGYGDYEGMDDSLQAYVEDHPDYNPAEDPELSLEDQAIVSIAMFNVAVQGGSTEEMVSTGGLVSFFAFLVSGFEINLSPDEGGGGGYIPHKGFIDNLHGMSDRSLMRTVRSLERNIDEHLDMIAGNPDSLAVSHWRSEIRNWQEELELALQEAARRGIK